MKWCVHWVSKVTGVRGRSIPMKKSLAKDWTDHLNSRWMPELWHWIRAEPIYYKGGKIWPYVSSHPNYQHGVYWRNSTRSQRCGSMEQARRILDIADFFGGAIHEVQL